MGLRSSPTHLHILRLGLCEAVNETLAPFVLGLVLWHAQSLTELPQRAGQAVEQCEDHRVDNLPHRHVYADVAQHCAVEGAVVDHDAVGVVDHRLQSVTPVRQALGLPDSHRVVVRRPRDEQNLGVFGVAVRARLNTGRAEGLEVEM